ncbi:2-keto-4-pentenoate hydratase [Herbaspirillum rhizosphaerae]|uniref:2-keto-4-pentenoate hydratase n=1 Tax=Herbaspirillum rhizosphaerae TaxID=346179 RepID=UPI00067CB939|nr:fumarylacetoacetate hydrolase family protein [Herbaspirillum rhizosphaerae]
MDANTIAQLLLNARAEGKRATVDPVLDQAQAYAVQDALLRELGPVAAWKVGAKGPRQEPICAPLPARGVLSSGVRLSGAYPLRGMEVELAFRLGRDFDVGDRLPEQAEIIDALEAMLPAIEVVESRLADYPHSSKLTQLADLQSHGALVVGAAMPLSAAVTDLLRTEARLSFDGVEVARTVGGNPAGDVWPVLAWLARHCSLRGMPLRKGQIITTGSCTGMLFADAALKVNAEIDGLGAVELGFGQRLR